MDRQMASLIRAYGDAEISPEQLEWLEQTLRGDPAAREQFLHEMNLRAVLEDAVLAQGDATDSHSHHASGVAAVNTGRTSIVARWSFAAATVLVASLVAIALWISINNEPQIATITDLGGSVQWTSGGGHVSHDLTPGHPLHGGTLELPSADSWAELKFTDGSTVSVSGPALLSISDRRRKELHFRHGRMSADVHPQPAGQPMLIHTPTADLEVLGTQFNVNAEAASTVLAVNKGSVRVTRLTDGKVAVVPAKHHVVASVDRTKEFNATRHRRAETAWRSQLPEGIVYGEQTVNDESGDACVRATALLWRGCQRNEQKPILLYLAALSVSRGEQSPVKLRAGARFRIRGHMESPQDLLVGLTTHHLQGGFAGKHHAYRKVDSFASDSGEFELEVPVEEFTPEAPEHPNSAVGLGLYDWWCLTLNEDAGLSVFSVELLAPDEPQ